MGQQPKEGKSRKPKRRSAGPPPAVLVLLLMECVAVVVLRSRGVSWSGLLKLAALPIALTMAMLTPWLQEWGRRQPKLTVDVNEADDDGVVKAPALRPWPISEERVVANELATARQSIEASRPLSMMQLYSDPFATKPSDEDYEQARAAFEQELVEYETELRSWLSDYSTAAGERAMTFELSLAVGNKRSGAYAEAVTLTLELPDSVTVADEWPSVTVPPEPPSYQPPRPRRSDWMHEPMRTSSLPWWFRNRSGELRAIAPGLLGNFSHAPTESDWKETDDGRTLEIAIGEVHTDRSVLIDEPVRLIVDRPGRHEVRWTAYSKSARRPAHGTIVLTVPGTAERPAFGRLAGITSYPDVPIVADDDLVMHDARVGDPPPRPKISNVTAGDVLEHLREAGALMQWDALGLDPATDGSDSHVVRVSEARRIEGGAHDQDDK